ncbi:MAG: carbon-nitrogen hydrolase [Planctomycetota bacterium]
MPTLALIQHACPPHAPRAQHLDTAEALIRDAAGQGAQIVATQELFASPYFPQTHDEAHFDLAEPIPGPTSQRLANLAAELDITLAASFFEKRAPGLYHNSTLTLSPTGQPLGLYRKTHIPPDPRFYEKYYFTPGSTPEPHPRTPPTRSSTRAHPITSPQMAQPSVGYAPPNALTTHTPHAQLANLICWDQWFPEPARLAALAGAQLILYPTAIGHFHHPHHSTDPTLGDTNISHIQHDAWHTMIRSHAIANGVFVAAINRPGTEHDLKFWGRSFAVAPDGQVLAEASPTDNQALIIDLDFTQIETQRRGWPFLRDRRPDTYQGLLHRYLN